MTLVFQVSNPEAQSTVVFASLNTMQLFEYRSDF
jgi:hypothetical protein